MPDWPRYTDCTPEQRRLLWKYDAQERRSERRWRELVVLTDPGQMAETLASDGTSTLPIDRTQIDANYRASVPYRKRIRRRKEER